MIAVVAQSLGIVRLVFVSAAVDFFTEINRYVHLFLVRVSLDPSFGLSWGVFRLCFGGRNFFLFVFYFLLKHANIQLKVLVDESLSFFHLSHLKAYNFVHRVFFCSFGVQLLERGLESMCLFEGRGVNSVSVLFLGKQGRIVELEIKN